MIVIKVEMWPYGVREQAYEVGRAYVYNTGGHLDDPTVGDYGVHVAKPHYFDEAASKYGAEYHSHRGYVHNFPRGPKNLWPLVLAALRSCQFRRSKGQPVSHGTLPAKEDVT